MTQNLNLFDSCSKLWCAPDYMLIMMDPLLFGLDDPESAIWASKATPFYDSIMTKKLVLDLPLGSDQMSIYTTDNEENIVTEVWIAITGEDRQRSSVRASEINLGGDLAVYSANVGISVSYKCMYPTKVGLSTINKTVSRGNSLGPVPV